MKPLKSQHGFTLLELLIAISIFAFIAVATLKNIQQVQNTKNTAMKELDLYGNIRAATTLMRGDLSQAFHVLYDDLGPENKVAVQQNQPVAHTLFDGRSKELIFTSLSRRVYYSNLKECEQTEISYFLQKKQGNPHPSLMKRESPLIDADLYQGGTVYTLLENVSSLDFQYWDPKSGKWVGDWNSDDGEFRDLFPQAVQMKVSILAPDGRTLSVEQLFKLAFPNNDQLLVQF